MATTLSSLPFESWALIAAQLEPPDRHSLAASCRTGQQAVSIVQKKLVVPGSQLCVRPLQYATECDSLCGIAADSWKCACWRACANDDKVHAQTSAGLCSSSPAPLRTGYDSSVPMAEQFGSWLQRYAGVCTLTLTSCDSCRGTAVPNAGLCLHTPCSPHTPTQTPSLASSCFSHSNSNSTSRSSQVPVASLAISLPRFLAAAGGSMPALKELDLSAACPCLHSKGGVLQAIAASCPRLEALSLPTWLLQPPALQPSSSFWSPSRSFSFSTPPRRLAAAAFWDPAPAAAAPESLSSPYMEPSYGLDRLLLHSQQLGTYSAPNSPELCLQPLRRKVDARPQQQQQQVELEEQLSTLAGLAHLTSLKLAGAAPQEAAVRLLAELTQLQTFALQVTDAMPNVPLPLSELPGWQGSGVNTGDSLGAGGNSGTVLGASLASLTRLTSLLLSGALHAAGTLQAVSVLPQLVRLEIVNLPDFSVGALASLSGLLGLTALRVEGCRALQATVRPALPLQLHVLQELAVLELDFDLHLRDMQVLCLLKRLSHLTANSFHHCIHLMTGLTLPALRFLRVAYVSRFTLQQQQGLAPGYQLAQALANPQMAAAAAVAPGGAAAAAGLPAPAAGTQGEIVVPPPAAAAAAAAAAAGAPVMPLSALPVLLNLQQQHHHQHQQQDDQPSFVLLAAPGGQTLLVHYQPQQHSAGPAALPGVRMHGAASNPLPLQQQQLPQQQMGLPNGINLQLLHLRQQQLHLQQQQLRLQQQQVRLQLQQMQAQITQHAQHAPQLATGAALPYGAAQQVQQHQVGVGDAAAAACAQAKGWLAVLFPGLEELHLASAKDCAAVIPALQGHLVLQKLVIGVKQAGQQQLGGLRSIGQGGSSNGMPLGGQAAGYGGGGSSRGVGASWGVLKSVPNLEVLEIHDAAVVLGTTPWTLGGAVSGQLCRLVLRGAGTLADLPAATLLGPYTWGKLTHLEIQGAEVLSNHGLNCFASLPHLQRLSLSYCPGVTACGLASFLLSASSSLRRLDLNCCAGVCPAEAQAVQDAVWSITHRRVDVCWSRHEPGC